MQAFNWRSVQDSNLCILIRDDGLAIRCITSLPTLRNLILFTLCFYSRQHIFFRLCILLDMHRFHLFTAF